jgi:pyruvate carboxylase
VARAYAQVNEMFGDIVKVTPTSKVVGDLALLMVTSGLTPDQVLDPQTQIAFPESVVSLFRGDLGPAVRRLSAGAAEEGAEGSAAAEGAAGRGAAGDRSWRRRTPSSIARRGARRPRKSSLPI